MQSMTERLLILREDSWLPQARERLSSKHEVSSVKVDLLLSDTLERDRVRFIKNTGGATSSYLSLSLVHQTIALASVK